MSTTLPRPVARTVGAALLFLIAGISCSGGDATSPSAPQLTQPTIASVVVQMNGPGGLVTGISRPVSAMPFDANGGVIAGLSATWTSSDTTIATVASTAAYGATVTGQGVGTATITGTISGKSGATLVAVTTPVPPFSVTVRPDSIVYVEGRDGFSAPVQLSATLIDSLGGALLGPVTWVSSDTTAATVSSTGVVTPNPSVARSSFVTITAMSGGKSGTSIVIVNPQVGSVTVDQTNPTLASGQTTMLHATVRDLNGNVLSGVPLSWVNFDARIVTLVRYADSAEVIAVGQGLANVVVSDPVSAGSANVAITVTDGLAFASSSASPAEPALPARLGRDRAKVR